MSVSYEEACETLRDLELEYQERHWAHTQLRKFWQGQYWQEADAGSHGITSIFRDLTAKRSDVGPDIKLVHNVLQEVCVKYQTFLSPLPMIRVYTDPPYSQVRKQQANLKEKVLYGLWSEGQMNKVLNRIAWYLPLMGDTFLGAVPNFEKKTIEPILRSPENAFPVMGADDQPAAHIFSWKWPESRVKRAYPNFELKGDQTKARRSFFGRSAGTRGRGAEPQVEIIEWYDNNEWHRWADDQELNGVEHNYGFNLFDQLSFIHVPDEPWNHGAVEQIVNLVEAGNALYSLMLEGVLQNVFPTLFLINPSKAPEQLDLGRGGVVPLNEGGDAKWLSPPPQAIQANMGMLGLNERNARQGAGMAGVDFGESPASSIVTGKAVNELQGASAGSVIEMVQGVGVGTGLVSWNEKALFMLRNLYGDDTIQLNGVRPSSHYDINPRGFGLTLKGKQLIGSQRNDVVFSPALDMHQKVVMGLQMAGAGLVSKKYQREQANIPDSEAMDEEMIGEAIQEGVVGAVLQQFMAQPTPEGAVDAEKQAEAYISGATPGPHPLTTMPAGPAQIPQPVQAGAPSGAAPTAAASPGGGPPLPPPGGAAAPPSDAVTIDQAVQQFQGVQGIVGQVFLVGEIVANGQTRNEIEVALTERSDQKTIRAALDLDLVFHGVAGDPDEPFIEVTPGQPPRQGGPAQ